MEADPDILFVGNAAPEEFLNKMEENGILVLSLEGLDLEGTYEAIINTGRAMGARQAAEDMVNSMKEKAADIVKKWRARKDPKSILLSPMVNTVILPQEVKALLMN